MSADLAAEGVGAVFDPKRIQEDFPILRRPVHGRRLVYLDNAATSQKPQAVIDALADYYARYNANVHRSVHRLAEEATLAYEAAREKVARFIGARRPEEVVFTSGTTEAINLVAYAWGLAHVRAGDEIVLTEMEHHSNIVPWQLLAERTGARVRWVPVREDGHLDLDALDRLLGERTRLVAVTHASNVLGTINPIPEIARRAHAAGALVLVDGAQSVPHLPVDVQALGADFVAFSGHKMCGPTGIGVLWARHELLAAMPPFLGGGEMIARVTTGGSTFREPPLRFEAGTPKIAGAVGLGVACEYLQRLDMAAVRRHERDLVAYALERLREIAGLTVYGPASPDERGGVVAFTLPDVHPHDLASLVDAEGVAIRAGHHCCQPLHDRLGVVATARASFYVYNTEEDVDALVRALHAARKVFAG